MANICVIGVGYVGLSCGVCLSELGHNVVCVDIEKEKIDLLNSGETPIMEFGLKDLLKENLKKQRLSFTTNLKLGVESSEFIFLCLGTPQMNDGSADLSTLMHMVSNLSSLALAGSVIITKSTVPIGTLSSIERTLRRSDVDVVSNPEFVREGSAVHDFFNPDRIVIGSRSDEISNRVAAIYQSLNAPVLITDSASAEAVKHAANSFLAVKLSYINAIAVMCELYGADVIDVAKGIGLDRRIGSGFLTPGPGWGGSCLPKDIASLLHMAKVKGFDFSILREAIAINQFVKNRIIEKVNDLFGGIICDRKIAVWGLTFKAETDDLRDSPAIEVISRLLSCGAKVSSFDPAVQVLPKSIDKSRLTMSAEESCESAELLIVLTDWPQFAMVNPSQVASRMASLQVLDCRNILDDKLWRDFGFRYQGIGR